MAPVAPVRAVLVWLAVPVVNHFWHANRMRCWLGSGIRCNPALAGPSEALLQ